MVCGIDLCVLIYTNSNIVFTIILQLFLFIQHYGFEMY